MTGKLSRRRKNEIVRFSHVPIMDEPLPGKEPTPGLPLFHFLEEHRPPHFLSIGEIYNVTTKDLCQPHLTAAWLLGHGPPADTVGWLVVFDPVHHSV